MKIIILETKVIVEPNENHKLLITQTSNGDLVISMNNLVKQKQGS